MSSHTEIRFEEIIEQHLLEHGGYEKRTRNQYDPEQALFPEDIIAFIEKTQATRWQAIKDLHGEKSPKTLLNSLVKELASKGSLYVLRHGFKCFGKLFRLAYFAPNSNMNPDTWTDYQKNTVTIARQIPFNPQNQRQSIDIVLAVNGLPVVTVELKNPMTGQTVQDAKYQYCHDRDPRCPLFRFKERALVHFAADTEVVLMTTKLEGKDTVFLPFNQGNGHGAGNPPAEADYRTSYFWGEVLTKDSLLDILARFLHLKVEEKKITTKRGVKRSIKETMIFPRYHQLDAVRTLIADAKIKGAGHNYLIQHSAGSGKSNTIAWIAHRLASLHDEQDNKVFDTVVVITDRLVLDEQLQRTIYQFDHKDGVVKKIDEDTQQLAKALSGGVPIVISTIQKFPWIAQALDTLEKKGEDISIDTKNRKFAVLVDEAHSSQSGEAAMELRKVLNKDGIEAIVAEQLLDDAGDDNLSEEARKAMLKELLKRSRQPNISYFAFTATPKFKTLAVFNEPGKNGKSPFHLYSMCQAIEEKFILDVLANYTTYTTYYKLLKSIEDDPEVPKKKAARQLARFVSFHPHNIAQKVEVIVEHFHRFTYHKIGGRAKAMVVTSSRLHAVRYKIAMDKYIADKGYKHLKTLVAFSGTVIDPDCEAKHYTEVGLNNGIQESALPHEFDTNKYQVLLVAEKYQTGFDQPLLHTMYVDKRLSGIQAVQALSRLNRITTGKEDTFILDFVNERDEIRKSFKDYYETTDMGDLPEAQQLYDLQHKLEKWQIFTRQEVDAYCEVWFTCRKEPTPGDHKFMNATIDIAVERYKDLSEEDQELFQGQMTSFIKLYAFLSQIIPYQDSELEKLYTYLRYLRSKLPRRADDSAYQLYDEVDLKYYRLQKISEGSIDLKQGQADPLKGPTDVGTRNVDEEKVQLSLLVDLLNDRFGTEFTPADELFFDQITETAIANEKLKEAAKVNTEENFKPVFEKMLEGLFIQRMEGNEEIFKKLMNDDKFRDIAAQHLVKEVYGRINVETK